MSSVTVTVTGGGATVPTDALLSVDIRREVNRIPQATLIFADGDPSARQYELSDRPELAPGRTVAISARVEGETPETTLFTGIVVRHGIEATAEGSALRLELKDAAVKMTQTRRTRIFPKSNDTDAITTIIRDALGKVGTVDVTTTEHEQLVQYAATDWDFLVSRAEVNGLFAVVTDGGVAVRGPTLSAPPALTLNPGTDPIYDYAIELNAATQYSAVSSTGWQIDEPQPDPVSAADFRLAQGNLDGATIARDVGFDPFALSHPVPLPPGELKAWADSRMMRSRLSMIRGRMATQQLPALALLDVIEIKGVSGHFNGKTVVTGIRHRIDADGWRTDVQFGASADQFTEVHDISDEAAAGLLPPVTSLQLGTVAEYTKDPKDLFRVMVSVPAFGKAGTNVWARLASPFAAKDSGFWFIPEEGDEVILGFFNDDPRQAVVVGSLYTPTHKPPAVFGTITEKNLKQGLVTRAGTGVVFDDDDKPSVTLETRAHNTITLDDKNATVRISDQHGNTITMDANGITIESASTLALKASSKVTINGTSVDIN